MSMVSRNAARVSEDGYFWHPMAHPNDATDHPSIRVVRGDGCFVYDERGNRLVDGTAGLWNVNVGHNRSEIKAAIVAQLDELEFFPLFGSTSHPRAEELAAVLVRMLAAEQMRRVIFSSGGSDAIETSLKIARQYWRLEGQAERTKFLSLERGYHGTHFGGASINGNTVFRRNYEPLLPGCFHVETPWIYRNPFTRNPEELACICASLLERQIVFQGPDTVAAFIAEPIQGAGGVIVPPPNYWPLVRKVCDKYGVLLIADEVVTGFGRSGSMFGSRGWGVAPDIMCFAKGISSGYIPLGATVVNERIEHAFRKNGDSAGAIMHGYTYSGHPVACAAAIANLKIVEAENLAAAAAAQGSCLFECLKPFEDRFASVGEVRGKGLMLALDLVKDRRTREPVDATGSYVNQLAAITREHGALVRPIGSMLILSPPLVLQRSHIDTLVGALEVAFRTVEPASQA